MNHEYQACIEACSKCANDFHCAVACPSEVNVSEMARCIALDMDCAAICRPAAGFMARGSDYAMKMGMEEMQKMEMSGDVDKDFAMMMKMHHQQALEMAKMEITNGKSPTMKAMAKKIIAAQKKEIAQFDQWLSKQN